MICIILAAVRANFGHDPFKLRNPEAFSQEVCCMHSSTLRHGGQRPCPVHLSQVEVICQLAVAEHHFWVESVVRVEQRLDPAHVARDGLTPFAGQIRRA